MYKWLTHVTVQRKLPQCCDATILQFKKKKCILDVDEMSVRVINKEESEGDIELYHEKQGQNYLAEER